MINDLRAVGHAAAKGTTTQPQLLFQGDLKKNCQFGFEFAINILGDRGSLDLPGGQVHRHRSSSAHILHGRYVQDVLIER